MYRCVSSLLVLVSWFEAVCFCWFLICCCFSLFLCHSSSTFELDYDFQRDYYDRYSVYLLLAFTGSFFFFLFFLSFFFFLLSCLSCFTPDAYIQYRFSECLRKHFIFQDVRVPIPRAPSSSTPLSGRHSLQASAGQSERRRKSTHQIQLLLFLQKQPALFITGQSVFS